MISFSQFRTTVYASVLTEAIIADQTVHYIGPASSSPTGKAYHNGVFSDDGGDTFYHIRANGTRMNLRSADSAENFAEILRRSSNKQLHQIDSVMDSHYVGLADHPSHMKAIQGYTKTSSTLNKKLIAGDTLTDSEKRTVGALDASMKAIQTPDDMVVYSGVSAAHAKVLNTTNIIKHDAYLSTSMSPVSASNFADKTGGDLISIHVPKGHDGAWAHTISPHHEHEFLLPRGLTLSIDRSKEQRMITPKRTYVVHHATIISKDTE